MPSNLATHALTIGGLTLGMMTHTARGHTGRPLRAEAVETACYVLIYLAAVVRVFVPLAMPALYCDAVIVSGALWIAAFAAFVFKYWPILTFLAPTGAAGSCANRFWHSTGQGGDDARQILPAQIRIPSPGLCARG